MMKIALVDDEKTSLDTLADYIARYAKESHKEFSVEQFSDGYKFIETCKNERFDIVFLDILMPSFTGLEIAKTLRLIDKYACLIFVTNFAKYALNGYEVGAFDFLVKPLTYLNFSLKFEKALRAIGEKEFPKIILKTDAGISVLAAHEIMYVESARHYVIYHTTSGVFRVRETMDAAEKKLEEMNFFRCHKAYIANLAFVKRVSRNSVLLGSDEIFLSRTKREPFLKKLAAYYGSGLR